MTVNKAQETRQSFVNDWHRPRYHYLPPANWMNDPNGVIQWNNRYHLFYQYNPLGAYHDNMHWGHAVSDDMIHWQDLPVAMAPTPNSVDEGGIFSGCIVDNDGTPTMFYTGVNANNTVQTQCIATSNEDLLEWQKHPANPVIPDLPTQMGQSADFRDPFVWRESDTWYMVVGSRIEGVGGAILLYRSSDLLNWEYLNPLFTCDSALGGIMWECPNFFPVGEKWVLILSSHIGYTTGTVLYYVGTYQNHRFIPDVQGVLDAGYYYAPLTHLDDQGRRIMYGWLREGRRVEEQRVLGWSGVQAIPRSVAIDDNNRLVMEPIVELAQLRNNHFHLEGQNADEKRLPVHGLSLEIRVSFQIDSDQVCGLVVAEAADGSEQTEIIYEPTTATLRVQRKCSDTHQTFDTFTQGIQHALDQGETLDLCILLDGSVLEIIANKRSSLTSRIYPLTKHNQYLRLINAGALQELDIWEMSSIW